ncbi:hypothetical protein SAMN06265222_101966 [Neorhodopirellula lusitana]|uniref:Uncharacterized protein n=1 Tax=Neorhodopirellula lusitana TaxID=445327 RepID=A0ABY1PRY6_9BACT|nr:hypothetical protein SAMN06265222_101966 [Neorhodopirellula lusitana]
MSQDFRPRSERLRVRLRESWIRLIFEFNSDIRREAEANRMLSPNYGSNDGQIASFVPFDAPPVCLAGAAVGHATNRQCIGQSICGLDFQPGVRGTPRLEA